MDKEGETRYFGMDKEGETRYFGTNQKGNTRYFGTDKTTGVERESKKNWCWNWE